MIDPQEFGAMVAKVGHLEKQVDKLTEDTEAILRTLQEARGGWRVLMLVGGLAGALGAALVKAAHWLKV